MGVGDTTAPAAQPTTTSSEPTTAPGAQPAKGGAPRLRLALLMCDTPMPSVQRDYGDYRQIFDDLLRRALDDARAPADTPYTLDAFDVVHAMAYPAEDALGGHAAQDALGGHAAQDALGGHGAEDAPDGYAAVILTGSAASAYEDTPWITRLVAWVRALARDRPRVRIFGICFGHQIVARALGGACAPAGTWEVGPTAVRLTDVGRAIFGREELCLQQMHRDHVPRAAPGSVLLGASAGCANQGMVWFYGEGGRGGVEGERGGEASSATALPPSSIHILTVQGHPEFTAEIVDRMVDARAAAGILPPALAADYAARRAWTNDGVRGVGRVIWRVLGAV
ncbi:class I glutamine amidotransferase-like protein [Schizophyllum fasciatum]